jgi:hypothetical protein
MISKRSFLSLVIAAAAEASQARRTITIGYFAPTQTNIS